MRVREVMHHNVVTLSGHQSLSEAVVMMETLQIQRLPVTQDNRLVGLITAGDLRRHLPALHEGLSPWAFAHRAGSVRVSEAMRVPVLSVLADDPLPRAVQTMLERRIGGLPVLDDDQRLVGMLTLTDVLRAALAAPDPGWGAVREYMSAAIGVTPDTPACEGAARLKVARLKVLPVAEAEVLVGVLHEHDLREVVARGEAARGRGDTVMGDHFFLQGMKAGDLMRPPAGVVLASLPLRAALQRMLDAQVHGLPVVSDGTRLLGVLTISDVLRAMLATGGAHPGHPGEPSDARAPWAEM